MILNLQENYFSMQESLFSQEIKAANPGDFTTNYEVIACPFFGLAFA
jgi:hypothetical protein